MSETPDEPGQTPDPSQPPASDPTAPYPTAGTPPSYGYGQPTYPPSAGYPQPPYEQGYQAQQGYRAQYQPGQPAGYPGGWAPTPPPHPQATTAMVLGLIGLIGSFILCGLPLVLSPFALVIGARARGEIDRSGGAYSGRDQAQVGFITGVIGTVFLVLALLALALVIVVAVGAPTYA